jgi:high affinity Mn2+ porin
VLVVAALGLLLTGFGDRSGVCFGQEGPAQDVVRLPPVPPPPQPGPDANAAPDQKVSKPPEPGPAAKPGVDSNGDQRERAAKENKEKDKDDDKDKKEKEDANATPQRWNFHAQTTAVVDLDPPFQAKYSGPNSLINKGEREETLSADLFAGVRLWSGAEFHADLLMWQGFGLTDTFGIEAFPNGDAYKAGTVVPDFMFAHLFVRQTFGLGGEQEDVPDSQFTLAGKQDISRLSFTVGRFSPSDICDNNTYAHDAHTQFLNYAMGSNITWDYPSDSVGFTTGIAVELNQPQWALRYGWFQMPGLMNGFTADDRILMWPGDGSSGQFWRSWGMMTELERRWRVDDHPGAIRFLAWLDQADFASFAVATTLLRANPPPPDAPQGAGSTIPPAAFDYRYKYGFGLNWEQELSKTVGLFSRMGWNDGHEAAWTYTDANWSVSLGMSVKGAKWNRPDDTVGLAGILSGASPDQIAFLKAGGTGILNGDGNLSYDCEKVLEAYYDFPIGKTAHFTMDYQFIGDPAFNRDRGPVSVFGVRLHWEE